MNVPDPAAGREVVKMPGDERAEQDRGQAGLGGAMGDGQPGSTERGPVDRLAAAECAGRIHEQVGVEVTQRPCIMPASGAKTAVLPEPEAPVTMNSGRSAAASSIRPHCGQTACPPPGSMRTGVSQDWQ